MTRILTSKGLVPLVFLHVSTEKSGSDAEFHWITSYRFLGMLVRQDHQQAGETLDTLEGPLRTWDIELSVRHVGTPCGLAIVSEFRYAGRLVKQDVRQEVYDFEGVKGGTGL